MTTELNQDETNSELHQENQEFFDNKERYVGKLFLLFSTRRNFLLLPVEKIVKRNLSMNNGPPTYHSVLVCTLLTKEKIEEYNFPLPWCENFSLVEETNQE